MKQIKAKKNIKMTEFLTDGPITPEFVAESIAKHSPKTNIGAHAIFLGQVRADKIEDKDVQGIEYSAYTQMAENVLSEIQKTTFDKYDDLLCLHIKHSIGMVKSGKNSLFVFVSSGHRKQAFKALEEVVNEIKAKVPIWKKEILDDDNYVWTENP